MAERKIVGAVDAALNESKSAEAIEAIEVIEAKANAERKKAEKKARAEAKAKAAQVKKDKDDHFTYTAKKVPTSIMERFNELKDLGIIEDSTSFNTFLKRALQNELIRNEKKKTI